MLLASDSWCASRRAGFPPSFQRTSCRPVSLSAGTLNRSVPRPTHRKLRGAEDGCLKRSVETVRAVLCVCSWRSVQRGALETSVVRLLDLGRYKRPSTELLSALVGCVLPLLVGSEHAGRGRQQHGGPERVASISRPVSSGRAVSLLVCGRAVQRSSTPRSTHRKAAPHRRSLFAAL